MNEVKYKNIVFIGQDGAGKSTLIGHLLHETDENIRRLVESNARRLGEGTDSTKYAWVLDEQEEREKGCSINIKYRDLNTANKNHITTLIDTPGRKEHVNNMIVGASQASCAVLVVSAAATEFEGSVDEQTKEGAIIAKAMGCELIVAVNKIDATNPPYSEERFQAVVSTMKKLIEECGYTTEEVPFVPISGLNGDNLVAIPDTMSWYKGWSAKRKDGSEVVGKTLLDSLQNIPLLSEASNQPLRIPISDVQKDGDGVRVTGCVESGTLETGSEIAAAPSRANDRVDWLEHNDDRSYSVGPGCIVTFKLNNVGHGSLQCGDVVGMKGEGAPEDAACLTARIDVLENSPEIRPELIAGVHCHTAQSVCEFDLLEKVDSSGKTLTECPESLRAGESGVVCLFPEKKIVVETFKKSPSLGRLVIRFENRTIATGVVLSVNS